MQIDRELGITTISFLTLLANQMYHMRLTARQRRWDQEDRARQHEELKAKIDVNTCLTSDARAEATRAYTEANSVNMKIASLGERIVALKKAEASVTPEVPVPH